MKTHNKNKYLIKYKQKKWFVSFLFVVIGIICLCHPVSGFELDLEAEEDDPSLEFFADGFIEFETYWNTYRKQDTDDSNVKNELRGMLEVRYGEEYIYIYSAMNAYVTSSVLADDYGGDYYYSDGWEISDNLRISSEKTELNFNELFFNYGRENYRFRIGNQMYGWGTADVNNPTAYFNPMDMRELLFKGQDEIKMGVPSLSAMIFLDNYTVEAVLVPYHIAPVLPPTSSYWEFEFGASGMDIVFGKNQALDKKWKNVGAGVRISTSVNGMDISVSGFHGPDVGMLAVPKELKGYIPDPDDPFSAAPYILVEPEYHLFDAIGVDFSRTFDSWVFQFEAIYSPNRNGLIEQDLSDLDDEQDYIDLLPFKTKKSHFISFSTGLNYFVPVENFIESYDGMTVLTTELSISQYLDSDLVPSFLGNILAFRLDSSFWEEKINISITGLYELVSRGYVVWPSVRYDFQNGFSTDLSYADIAGVKLSGSNTDNILYNIKNKDVLMWRIHYDF